MSNRKFLYKRINNCIKEINELTEKENITPEIRYAFFHDLNKAENFIEMDDETLASFHLTIVEERIERLK